MEFETLEKTTLMTKSEGAQDAVGLFRKCACFMYKWFQTSVQNTVQLCPCCDAAVFFSSTVDGTRVVLFCL